MLGSIKSKYSVKIRLPGAIFSHTAEKSQTSGPLRRGTAVQLFGGEKGQPST